MDTNPVKMYFEEEGCNSFSRKNPNATGVQKLEVNFIRELLCVQANDGEERDGPFTVADFGTADGAGFIQVIPEIVDMIRIHYGKEKQVSVILEDLPENDFKSVFRNVAGTSHASPIGCHTVPLQEGVFVTVSGTSFYKQCLSSNSLSLVCSSTALHHLSKRPCLVDTIFYWFADKSIQPLVEKQAEQDWETFLLHRARELTSGGLMVLLVLGTDEEGKYVGNTRANTRNLAQVLADLWTEYCRNGVISQEEVRRTTYGIVLRTKEDLMKPFETNQSPPRKAGLKLYRIEKVMLDSTTYSELLQSSLEHDISGKASEYADSMVDHTKSWCHNHMYQALDQSRTEEEKQQILDRYFAEFKSIVSREPLCFAQECLYYAVLITKE